MVQVARLNIYTQQRVPTRHGLHVTELTTAPKTARGYSPNGSRHPSSRGAVIPPQPIADQVTNLQRMTYTVTSLRSSCWLRHKLQKIPANMQRIQTRLLQAYTSSVALPTHVMASQHISHMQLYTLAIRRYNRRPHDIACLCLLRLRYRR